jgi:hypothetical protein
MREVLQIHKSHTQQVKIPGPQNGNEQLPYKLEIIGGASFKESRVHAIYKSSEVYHEPRN